MRRFPSEYALVRLQHPALIESPRDPPQTANGSRVIGRGKGRTIGGMTARGPAPRVMARIGSSHTMRMGVTTRDVGKVVTVAPISVRRGITANSATTANPTVGKQRLSRLRWATMMTASRTSRTCRSVFEACRTSQSGEGRSTSIASVSIGPPRNGHNESAPKPHRCRWSKPFTRACVDVCDDTAILLVEGRSEKCRRADRQVGELLWPGRLSDAAKPNQTALDTLRGQTIEIGRAPHLIRPVARIGLSFAILDAGELHFINPITALERRVRGDAVQDDTSAVW